MRGTRHPRRVYLPGRQLCGPWQHQASEPPSERPIGTDGTVGTDTIIGTVAIIGIDTIIGVRITVATTITGIPIIGNSAKT